ncbi:YegP family protein [Pseudomonas chlororaphis]|uniref:DUF1508 domain-containing protein n=1 Tax=Pseudomonas chlororaphis O6 TaxID=1037915 RepID=A0AB33WJ28_9PSED|nr:YegP family protein [Pseudomonas chlororaphis]EIM13321.1 hypothetical protein PchlO6_6062 [Pseudomonas chlororaphis O6]
MPGWYEIKKNSSGSHRFLLKTTASGTLLESGCYESLDKTEQAIQDLSSSCASLERFRRHMASCGKSYFSLRDKSGAVLLQSKLYDSEATCDKAIEMIARAGINGEIRPYR